MVDWIWGYRVYEYGGLNFKWVVDNKWILIYNLFNVFILFGVFRDSDRCMNKLKNLKLLW